MSPLVLVQSESHNANVLIRAGTFQEPEKRYSYDVTPDSHERKKEISTKSRLGTIVRKLSGQSIGRERKEKKAAGISWGPPPECAKGSSQTEKEAAYVWEAPLAKIGRLILPLRVRLLKSRVV